jgi:di/tricarboxylate transporter
MFTEEWSAVDWGLILLIGALSALSVVLTAMGGAA